MIVIVFQLLSCIWLFATPWTIPHWAALSFTISWSLLKLMSIESVMPSNHLILCRPLLLLHKIPASGSFLMSQLFASGGKVLELQLLHQSFSDYSGMISFRIDWFDLPCSPRGPQESSPTSQFKTIRSSTLRLLYGPTLTSIHDYWKNHSLD